MASVRFVRDVDTTTTTEGDTEEDCPKGRKRKRTAKNKKGAGKRVRTHPKDDTRDVVVQKILAYADSASFQLSKHGVADLAAFSYAVLMSALPDILDGVRLKVVPAENRMLFRDRGDYIIHCQKYDPCDEGDCKDDDDDPEADSECVYCLVDYAGIMDAANGSALRALLRDGGRAHPQMVLFGGRARDDRDGDAACYGVRLVYAAVVVSLATLEATLVNRKAVKQSNRKAVLSCTEFYKLATRS